MMYLRSRIAARRLIALALVSVAIIGVVAVVAIVNPFSAKKAAAASVTTCNRTGTVDVNGKTYEAQNNLWNSAATGQQCISVDNNSGAFTVTTNNNSLSGGAPASYPSIYKGCHWGDCTNNSNLPIQESNIGSVNSSWSITTVGGVWDASYDIWFNTTPTTSGQPDGTEIMVWINHSGASPFGSNNGTVNINGSNWTVFTGRQTSWNIISYEDNSPTTSVNFDLKNFFSDAVARGSLQNNWYLIDVEAGFELWQNGVGMTSNSFSVNPVAGGGGGNPTPTPGSGGGSTGVLRGVQSNRCLDVPNRSTNNGTLLDIWDCNGGSNQQWTALSNGELQVYGNKCLDVPNHNRSAGTRVEIWDCNGGANQQWTLNSNGTVVGVESGLCLDVTGQGTANGTAVEIWTCNGGSNQQWSRS